MSASEADALVVSAADDGVLSLARLHSGSDGALALQPVTRTTAGHSGGIFAMQEYRGQVQWIADIRGTDELR